MQGQVKAKEKFGQAAEKRERAWLGSGIRLGTLVRECAWISGGWLLGQAELAFATFPLGLALLCASGHHTLPILAGLLAAGALYMPMPSVYIVTYLAAALVRLAVGLFWESGDLRASLGDRLKQRLFSSCGAAENQQDKWLSGASGGQAVGKRVRLLFGESLALRMCTGAIGALIISLCRILLSGFQYYDLYAAVLSVVLTPAAVLVYSFCLDGEVKKTLLYRVSVLAVLFSLVYAANSVLFLGLPFAPVLAMLFTLALTEREGLAMGAAGAALLGAAYHPLHVPAYLFAALIGGIAGPKKNTQVRLALALTAAYAWLIYARGISSLLTFFPVYLLSGAVFVLAVRLGIVTSPEAVEERHSKARMQVDGARHRDANERFRGISEAFSSLSEVFYSLSDRFRRPGVLDLHLICDRSFDRYCTDCPNKTLCWGLEYSSTLGVMNRLTSALHTKGRVTRGEIPPALLARCESASGILESINRECARLTGEMLRNNRTEIFAMDYEAAASIINDALEEDDGEYRFDPDQEQKITEYLRDAGVRADSVTVYGKRRRQILVRNVNVESARVTVDTLCADLGEMCGISLSRPSFSLEGNCSTMTLSAKKRISVSGAKNNLSAHGDVSGDSLNLFSNKKDFFYALISDGMGCGSEAASTSQLCSVFLEKMLRAGNRAATSLKMLNNLVRSRSSDSRGECSSTVDLLELDLMSGEGVFIKSGAAPSFVVRGGVVHCLRCGSAPIGIIGDLDAQKTPVSVRAGDLVVMVSDGILANDPKCEWLISFLGEHAALTPEEIVYRICMRAAEFRQHDDCSAIALRIERAAD